MKMSESDQAVALTIRSWLIALSSGNVVQVAVIRWAALNNFKP